MAMAMYGTHGPWTMDHGTPDYTDRRIQEVSSEFYVSDSSIAVPVRRTNIRFFMQLLSIFDKLTRQYDLSRTFLRHPLSPATPKYLRNTHSTIPQLSFPHFRESIDTIISIIRIIRMIT